MEEKKKDRNLRSAIIRVSAKNEIHTDNKALGLKVGDVVEYSLQDILFTLDDWCKTKLFDYYVIEHNENAENVHFHIVIVFRNKSQCKFSTLKKKFPFGYIDSCRHGVHACVRYLTHSDNPEKQQYNWEDIITNNRGKLETYKQPSKYSEELYVNKIVQDIVSGRLREYELTDKVEPILCVKYHNVFDNAFKIRAKTIVNNPNRNIMICVLQGESRVGKSTWVKTYAEQNNLSLCLSSSSNDGWQDYRGQDIFCYDDFNYEKTKIEDFIKAIDPYNNTSIQSRYRNRPFIGSIIFICTNTPITKFYIGSSDRHRSALFKRISYVLDFTEFDEEKNISYYTVNKLALGEGYSSITDDYDIVLSSNRNWKLEPIDDVKHSFDLNKYVNLKSNDEKNDKFLENISKL